jgi:hypothetical protein
MELKIKEEYLEELIDYIGRSLCGKVMKRFEVIEDKVTLKNMIKETIYEEMRHFKDLLYSSNAGLEMSQFIFKKTVK